MFAFERVLDNIAFYIVAGVVTSMVNARIIQEGLGERKSDAEFLGQGLRIFPIVSVVLVMLGLDVVLLIMRDRVLGGRAEGRGAAVFFLALEAADTAAILNLVKATGERVGFCKRVRGFDAMVTVDHIHSIATASREASKAHGNALTIRDILAVGIVETPRLCRRIVVFVLPCGHDLVGQITLSVGKGFESDDGLRHRVCCQSNNSTERFHVE